MVNFFIIFYYKLKNPTANIILNIELLEAIPLNQEQDTAAYSHYFYSTMFPKSSAIKHKMIVKNGDQKGKFLQVILLSTQKAPENLHRNYEI